MNKEKQVWDEAARQEWIKNGLNGWYEQVMCEFRQRWGIEETIDIECEVVEPKRLEPHGPERGLPPA